VSDKQQYTTMNSCYLHGSYAGLECGMCRLTVENIEHRKPTPPVPPEDDVESRTGQSKPVPPLEPPYAAIDKLLTERFGWPWEPKIQTLYAAICDLFDGGHHALNRRIPADDKCPVCGESKWHLGNCRKEAAQPDTRKLAEKIADETLRYVNQFVSIGMSDLDEGEVAKLVERILLDGGKQ
jgi:hypothetical protein